MHCVVKLTYIGTLGGKPGVSSVRFKIDPLILSYAR